MSKLVHDDARYSDGRKVCLGDVVSGPSRGSGLMHVGSASFRNVELEDGSVHVDTSVVHVLHVLAMDNPNGLGFLAAEACRFIRRTSRREFFELVGIGERIQRLYFWNSPGIADDFRPWVKEREEQLFNAWLDEPMFNEEGVMQ